MRVTVKLFATLRDGRFSVGEREYGDSVTPRNIARELDIPEREIALILVNGRHTDLDHHLDDGDTLALFPPVGGG